MIIKKTKTIIITGLVIATSAGILAGCGKKENAGTLKTTVSAETFQNKMQELGLTVSETKDSTSSDFSSYYTAMDNDKSYQIIYTNLSSSDVAKNYFDASITEMKNKYDANDKYSSVNSDNFTMSTKILYIKMSKVGSTIVMGSSKVAAKDKVDAAFAAIGY